MLFAEDNRGEAFSERKTSVSLQPPDWMGQMIHMFSMLVFPWSEINY